MGLSTARKIWGLLTPPERRSALVLLALTLIGTALETLGIGLVIPAIALFTQPDALNRYPMLDPVVRVFGNTGHEMLVIGAMLGLLGVFVVKTAFLAFLAWRQLKFAFRNQASLSQRLYEVYLRQPYTFHLQRNSAQLIRNSVNEVNLFTFSVLIPAIMLVTEGLILPGLCILLFVVEPVGALVVVVVLGAVAWIFHLLTAERIAHWGERRQYHEGKRIQHLQQGLGGAKEVKLLGRENEFLDEYAEHNARSARVGQLQLTLQQFPRLLLELLAVVGLVSLVLTAVAQGRELVSVLPLLGLFAAAAFRLMPSVNRIIGSLHSLRYGLAVVNTLCDELKLVVPPARALTAPVASFRESIVLDDVAYTYAGAAAPSVAGLSLVIRRGETVGFIGPSGAGKSTLVDLLLGLLPPDGGRVLVDGVDIQDSLRGWQDQIGYVSQSIFLTDDTIRRNVAFGLPAARIDERAVWRAVRAAQLEHFVKNLPQGLDTMVGERGVRLSGGQRQRIGIARALYHDPATLVLDEASSSLDIDTEREVMQAVDALRGAKTIVIVAHRLSTVAHCGRIYRLEFGKIVAAGTPQDLLGSRLSA